MDIYYYKTGFSKFKSIVGKMDLMTVSVVYAALFADKENL